MKKLDVELGERSYPIYIEFGIAGHIAEFVQKHQSNKNIFIITDSHVAPLYVDAIQCQLEAVGYQSKHFVVPAGESSKSLTQANAIYTWLLENNATRQSTILALGGGVIGDLAGFVAATFMRGIPFMQMPTTLLSQVDSSVGGKVGINHPLGKNLIGAFYQPQAVIIDPDVLSSLPSREIRAGMAEVIKYGFIADAEFYDFVVQNLSGLFNLENPEHIQHILYKSCAIKADVVRQDEREGGLRAILNFGHTIGHALEAVTAYKHFLHGEALVYGMQAALHLSQLTAFGDAETIAQAQQILQQFAPPAIPAEITLEQILAATLKDKKRSEQGQLWILLDKIGSTVRTRRVENSMVREAVKLIL